MTTTNNDPLFEGEQSLPLPENLQEYFHEVGEELTKKDEIRPTQNGVTTMQANTMNFNAVPRLVGKLAKERFMECKAVLDHTQWPLYLVGPSGSGKTIMAMNLAKAYAKENGVPAYYVQLSPDQTKTSVILGLRLVNGSLVPVKGMVAEAMEQGGIVVVDEATHTTQELLLMFNSILDRTSVTSIGDEVVYAADSFRIIFCSNNASYAGNVRLPQSFAQRLVSFAFDYPSIEDEVKIAQKIASDEYRGSYDVPESVARYLAAFVRDVRSESFPLSARNIAIALIRLAISPKAASDTVDTYFMQDANVESTRRQIAKRILGQEVDGVQALTSEAVMSFVQYVSRVGVNKFREVVLSASMYHIDVDGTELSRDVVKNKIASSVI